MWYFVLDRLVDFVTIKVTEPSVPEIRKLQFASTPSSIIKYLEGKAEYTLARPPYVHVMVGENQGEQGVAVSVSINRLVQGAVALSYHARNYHAATPTRTRCSGP